MSRSHTVVAEGLRADDAAYSADFAADLMTLRRRAFAAPHRDGRR